MHKAANRERRWDRERLSIWHNVEHYSILVILWDTKLSIITRFIFFYSRTVRRLHLLTCQMQCWPVYALEQPYSFPKWQIYIFKTNIHHDNAILAFPTCQKRWSFPYHRNERETASRTPGYLFFVNHGSEKSIEISSNSSIEAWLWSICGCSSILRIKSQRQLTNIPAPQSPTQTYIFQHIWTWLLHIHFASSHF